MKGMAMKGIIREIGIIVVDMQSDFTEFQKGSLAVAGTNESYVKQVQGTVLALRSYGYPIYATQDWHPANHASFYTNHEGKKPFDTVKLHGRDQVLWPPHCVQQTPGAGILIPEGMFKAIFKKGMDPDFDSYSGIQDDGGKKTAMDETLKKEEINKLILFGIATDYCVRATAIDAAAIGYKVMVIRNLCRGVAPETTEKAIEEMKVAGIMVLNDLDMEKIGNF
jgi:nicotinamidase/pyrazinamidase